MSRVRSPHRPCKHRIQTVEAKNSKEITWVDELRINIDIYCIFPRWQVHCCHSLHKMQVLLFSGLGQSPVGEPRQEESRRLVEVVGNLQLIVQHPERSNPMGLDIPKLLTRNVLYFPAALVLSRNEECLELDPRARREDVPVGTEERFLVGHLDFDLQRLSIASESRRYLVLLEARCLPLTGSTVGNCRCLIGGNPAEFGPGNRFVGRVGVECMRRKFSGRLGYITGYVLNLLKNTDKALPTRGGV
mmetsp:Transcript_24300/g.43096  ORF Transcript_24300/g.43096 Transcript_24300/m.43096 type:complete len:246 (-) Transcript_24300:182-919(-)